MSWSQQKRLKGVAREIGECGILEAKWRKFQIGDSHQDLKASDWLIKMRKENGAWDLAKWRPLVTLIIAFSADCWVRKLHWNAFEREWEERGWGSGYRSLFQGILPWNEGEKNGYWESLEVRLREGLFYRRWKDNSVFAYWWDWSRRDGEIDTEKKNRIAGAKSVNDQE